ncbi:MAG TPA: hypothetical protein VM285_01935 [Polyangia bacterium]|nr:hypothetical protein [Polyangia bacterium]
MNDENFDLVSKPETPEDRARAASHAEAVRLANIVEADRVRVLQLGLGTLGGGIGFMRVLDAVAALDAKVDRLLDAVTVRPAKK